MTNAVIRWATPADAPAIQDIYAPYVREHIYSFEITPPSVAEMEGRVKATLAGFPWLVCVHPGRGELVGYAYASKFNERYAYQWSISSSVYVRQGWQRQKIGFGLYSALFDLLRLQGFYNAFAGVTLPNPASVGLHQAMGFTSVGTYPNVGYKLGGWHDVSWWGLSLQPLSEGAPVPPLTPTALDQQQIQPILDRSAALIHLTN